MKYIQYSLILVVLIGITIKASGQSNDRWYILSLGEKPVGYYHDVINLNSTKGQTLVITENSFKMSISRLGSTVELESVSKQVESQNGNLKSVYNESLLSKQSSIIRATIFKSKIHVITSVGGRDQLKEVAYKGILTGAEGLRLLTVKNIKKIGDSVTYQTYIPDFNMVVTGTRKFISKESLNIAGKAIKVIKVADGYRGIPVNRLVWLDYKGRMLKSSEPNPYGQLTLLLSNKTNSLNAFSKKAELSVDQYTNTIAKSNVRLPQARNIQSITLKIQLKNPQMGFPDFSGPYQQVLEKGNDYVILKINSPKSGENKDPLFTKTENQFKASSSFINKDDTVIIKTVKQIIGTESDPWKKTALIRDWVNSHMKFNPGIAMASSTEIIRNMEGTCVSFATIMTTLCRAASIPARFVMGYVYTDGMWGGHAWAEINVNSSWYPVDAAMVGPYIIADAARFYYVRSSLNNGPGEALLGGQQLYSNVNITVLDYRLNNETVKPGKNAFVITDSSYYNPGLELSMKKLDGFKFTSTDQVYPENILFSLKKNNDTTQCIKLFQYHQGTDRDLTKQISSCLEDVGIKGQLVETTYNDNLAFSVYNIDQSAIAIVNGIDIYLLTVKSKDPKGLLTVVLQGLRFKRFPKVEFQ